jgi:ABC-type transport system involved in multi-copper enzyme maturation permease subunit
MRTLIWKECRLNAWVLVLGAVLGLGPYVVGGAWALFQGGPRSMAVLRPMLESACAISLEASLLTLLLLGANSIARERVDRSAEFLAYLPVSRARILVSKAAVPLAMASVVWTAALAAHVLAYAIDGGTIGSVIPPGLGWAVLAISILLFGAVWLGSSIVDTPLTAVGFCLGICMLLWSAFVASNHFLGWPADRSDCYTAGMGIVGISCFIAGSWLYLRRVEP